jgi:hypothetical protein
MPGGPPISRLNLSGPDIACCVEPRELIGLIEFGCDGTWLEPLTVPSFDGSGLFRRSLREVVEVVGVVIGDCADSLDELA